MHLQDPNDPSESKSVSLTASMWTKVGLIVDSEYRGNRSVYFQELIQKNFEERGLTGAMDELEILIRELLAERGADAVKAKLTELRSEQLAAAGEDAK